MIPWLLFMWVVVLVMWWNGKAIDRALIAEQQRGAQLYADVQDLKERLRKLEIGSKE